MLLEIVVGGEGDLLVDIWVLGCVVVEMVFWKLVWNLFLECDVSVLLYWIGVVGEFFVIFGNLCFDGKDFIGKCFVKDLNERWIVQMLLDYLFLIGLEDLCCCNGDDKFVLVFLRCLFEFLDWEFFGELSLNLVGFFDFVGFLKVFEILCWSFIFSRFE